MPDSYLGSWESFTIFFTHPDFIEFLHIAGPILPILAVGIRDGRWEGIKQVCKCYIVASIDEAVTELN